MPEHSNESATGQQIDPYDAADLNKWAARAYWTPAEIAALSLGKHPWSLNRESFDKHPHSWFSLEFLERLDVFVRAAETNQISWQCPPNGAVEFMERLGMPFVSGLKEQVERFHPIKDWEAAFNGVLSWARANQLSWQAELAKHRDALAAAHRDSGEFEIWRDKAETFIQRLMAENREVSRQLAELQAASDESQSGRPIAANDNQGETLSPKERHSKDMMIAAMAIVGYSFDPASKRSAIPAELAGDIASIGFSLTPEVTAKHIRDACRRLGISARPDQQD